MPRTRFLGEIAEASLKPDQRSHPQDRESTIPRRNRRGLIEAHVHVAHVTERLGIPRRNRRGLIEARSARVRGTVTF